MRYDQPYYPKRAAIYSLKRMKAVKRHWEFLVQESERERDYFVSVGDFEEIQDSELIALVEEYAQNVY